MKPLQQPAPADVDAVARPRHAGAAGAEGVHTGYLLLVPREEAAPRYREYLRRGEAPATPTSRTSPTGRWSTWTRPTSRRSSRHAAIEHAFTQVFGFGDVGGVPICRCWPTTWSGAGSTARPDRPVPGQRALPARPQAGVRRLARDRRAAAPAAATEGLFNTICAEFNIGYLDEESLMRSMQLFATRVIPALRLLALLSWVGSRRRRAGAGGDCPS